MVQGIDLEFSYGSRKILNGIDIELKEGELVTLLGRNGEGKSTLFKILTGEIIPQKGIVQLENQNIRNMGWRELACKRSVLPQESVLNFPLRVGEIVSMGRSPHQKNKMLDGYYAEKSMVLTDVWHLKDRFYSHLSGGERKRVQIARVLCQLENLNSETEEIHHERKSSKGFLFLDEPVNSLDVLLQHKIMDILRNLTDLGYSVFAILHDWNLAGLYSDRIMVLHHGSIAFNGSPKEVIQPEMLKSIFGIESKIFNHRNERIGGYSTKTI